METAVHKRSKNVKDVSMTAPEIGLLTFSDFTDVNEKWRKQVQMEEIIKAIPTCSHIKSLTP